MIACQMCQGTGQVRLIDTVDDEVSDLRECPRCKGTGEVDPADVPRGYG